MTQNRTNGIDLGYEFQLFIQPAQNAVEPNVFIGCQAKELAKPSCRDIHFDWSLSFRDRLRRIWHEQTRLNLK